MGYDTDHHLTIVETNWSRQHSNGASNDTEGFMGHHRTIFIPWLGVVYFPVYSQSYPSSHYLPGLDRPPNFPTPPLRPPPVPHRFESHGKSFHLLWIRLGSGCTHSILLTVMKPCIVMHRQNLGYIALGAALTLPLGT